MAYQMKMKLLEKPASEGKKKNITSFKICLMSVRFTQVMRCNNEISFATIFFFFMYDYIYHLLL